MIYTKTGDDGTTSLFNSDRCKKSDPVFGVLGTLDELNSSLGFLHIYKNDEIVTEIKNIQKDLLYLGSLISGSHLNMEYITQRTEELETVIDKYEERLEPLTNFILPGGSIFSSYLNMSRSICRRVERDMVKYDSNITCLTYTNRLSDLFFVLARYINKVEEIPDTIWKHTV